MKNPHFWREHYVIESSAEKIQKKIRRTTFISNRQNFELVYFESRRKAPNILISQGSGGHALVFAELAYLMHSHGYNVFIMPKHGGFTIDALMQRQLDAISFITANFSRRIGVYSEGLGGFVTFYLTLAKAPIQSAVYQNSPALLTERSFHECVVRGWHKVLFSIAKFLSRFSPNLKLPISSYLNWKRLIDSDPINNRIETRLVRRGYLRDPDFDRWYPLSAILSLLQTPSKNPLTALKTATMFMVASRGFAGDRYAEYLRDLFARLPVRTKKIEIVDGSVYWMLSHPALAAKRITDWFKLTL